MAPGITAPLLYDAPRVRVLGNTSNAISRPLNIAATPAMVAAPMAPARTGALPDCDVIEPERLRDVRAGECRDDNGERMTR